jgi:hypothetical protein
MFGGVALALSELPEELVERHELWGRVHHRGGEPEVRDPPDVAPVRPRSTAWADFGG